MTHIALPTNTSMQGGAGIFSYLNSVSPIIIPTFLIFTFFGFLIKQIQNNNPPETAFFSASLVTVILAGLLWIMEAVTGYIAIAAVVLFALCAGNLYWNR